MCEFVNPDYALIQPFTPLPGTDLYISGLKQGLYGDYWRRFSLNPVANFRMPIWGAFDADILDKIITKSYFSFYIRLSFILSRLCKIGTWIEFMEYITIFFKILLKKEYNPIKIG